MSLQTIIGSIKKLPDAQKIQVLERALSDAFFAIDKRERTAIASESVSYAESIRAAIDSASELAA